MAAPADRSLTIRPEWDATLTYDDLAGVTDGVAGPVFVGRAELLDVIVGAIRQPDRRGTFLVSGYRGAGKTSLLIEAIRRVGRLKLLAEGWQLVPLVLNASEVSAALPPSAGAGTPAARAAASLQIGPQQLLTALVRTLRNYAERDDVRLPAALKTDIRETYRKALAKEYSRAEGTQDQRTWTLTRESEGKISSADVYKGLSALGATAAVAIEGSAWLPTAGGAALHAMAAVSAALAAASWSTSRKLSEVARQESTQAVSVKFDNSLQQLEGDLKELLSSLHRERRRVVVLLEELDKLRDEDGEQLDSVICYFKNLFTQAPALFFFVTDKDYYDFIAGRIRQARRERSYAIQHTFFTHRLFVGRPTTTDCVNFLASILADEAIRTRLATLYAKGGLEPFTPAIAQDPLLRFVRSLLFKSSNHLFDLKNELRRFVRTHEANHVLDIGALSDDDLAAGIFEDLIVQKYGLFAFGDGRPYANEVLNDCLYAVFGDLGSDLVQQVASCYPRARGAAAVGAEAAAAARAGGAGEDQLELSEDLRIRAAVDSLIEDLQRGGAFEADKTNITQGHFVWKRAAARAFQFQRRLERHESELVDRLVKLRAAVAPFATGGPLAAAVNIQALADTFLSELDEAKKGVETTDRTLSVDQTDKLSLEWQKRAKEPIAQAHAAHLNRLKERAEVICEPIGSSAEGGTLWLVWGFPGDADPGRVRSGAVLLAQGEGGRLDDDVREFIGRLPGLRRLAILHVVDGPAEPAILVARQAQWRAQLAETMARPTPTGSRRGLAVETLSLDEGWPASIAAASWGDQLAELALFHTTWTDSFASRPFEGMDLSRLAGRLNEPAPSHPLVSCLEEWLKGGTRLLHVSPDGWAPIPADSRALTLKAAVSRIDTPEVVGYLHPLDSELPTGFLGAGPGQKHANASADGERFVTLVARLIAQRRVILIADVQQIGAPGSPESVWNKIAQLIGEEGRAIVVAPEPWGSSVPASVSRSTLRVEPAASPQSNA